MFRSALTLMAFGILGLPTAIIGQGPEFEVASVRVVSLNSSENGVRFLTRITDHRVDWVQSLRTVLLRAFEVENHQLVLPDWAEELIVDIRATIPSGVTAQQLPEMLRRLLVTRFALVTHREARPIDAYHLLVGASGIKMRSVEALNELDEEFDSVVLPKGGELSGIVRQTPEGRTRTIHIPGGSRRLTSRTRYDITFDHTTNTQKLNAVRMTMAELVRVLALNLDTPVIDRTDLNGIYQFTIELPPDEAGNRALRRAGISVDSTPSAASTFNAIEALGLKLERRREPVDVIVVDAMRREPTEN